MVHFYRNVFSHVPATKVREVSHMLKAIHAQESRDAADRKARAIVDDLRTARMNTAADLVERSVSETLTYYAFPDIHWQKIRTNNPLERIMREIRRRTRVVGAFPDGQSCLNLAAARLRYIAGTAWSAKCYMNMRPLYQPQVVQTEARHPRWTFHFTPTSASWLNAVEGFFAKLTRRRLKRGVFRSVDDLKAAIDRFVAETNADPKPFVWTAKPNRVLAAVKRGKQALESIH